MTSVGIPKYALVPLFILWFGIDDAPKLWLVGLLVFYVDHEHFDQPHRQPRAYRRAPWTRWSAFAQPPDTHADCGSAVILQTRSRILEVAVRLYRRLGHRKTTVIDIAHEISMSPANCYRFFRSKQAIKEAVVGKLLEQVVVAALGAARSASSATVQLQAVLQEIERLHKNRFMQDKSLHDLVATAMRENWTSVRALRRRE